MKKIFTLSLILLCSFMLIGCGNNESTQKEDSKTKEEVKENKEKKLICEQPQHDDTFDGTNEVEITYDKDDKAKEMKLIYDWAVKYETYSKWGDEDTKEQNMQNVVSSIKEGLIKEYDQQTTEISTTHEKNRFIVTINLKDEETLKELAGIEKDKEDLESDKDNTFYCQIEEIE